MNIRTLRKRVGQGAAVAGIAALALVAFTSDWPIGGAEAAKPRCPQSEVRVSDFGTVGNNADITSPLKEAIACLSPETPGGLNYGGTVMIDAGRHVVGCDIAIPNGVTLRGAGPQATALVLKDGAQCKRGVIVNAEPRGQHTARLRDLGVYAGPGKTPAVVSFECVFDGSMISDVIVAYSSGDGIQAGCTTQPVDKNQGPNSGPWSMDRITMFNIAQHGIHIRGSAYHVAIRESTVATTGGAGIYLEGAIPIEKASPLWGIRIADVHFEATRWGIWIQNSSAISLDNVGLGNITGALALVRITGQRGNGIWSPEGIDARGLTGHALVPTILDETGGGTVTGKSFIASWQSK